MLLLVSSYILKILQILMSQKMTLVKRLTCCLSWMTDTLPCKATEIPQFQETFRTQQMGLKLRRLLLGSGGLATLSLPGSCDVWSWGDRFLFSLVSWSSRLRPFLEQITARCTLWRPTVPADSTQSHLQFECRGILQFVKNTFTN